MHTQIITVNYHSGALISNLEEVVRGIEGVSFVVVDNTGDLVIRYNTTKVLSAGRNLGFAKACNLAAARSDADILLFVNPDLSLSQSALCALLDQTPQNRMTIWGPTILDRHGKTSALLSNAGGLIRYKRIAYDPVESGIPVPVLYVSGACFGIYRAFFNELGGFHPDVFMYAEDMDLCIRAKAAGGTICCFPDIRVRHEGGRSSSKVLPKFLRFFRSFNGHYRVLITRHSRFSSLINAVYLASGFKTHMR